MADLPIYFRDKKDELKGPFTEKQMQEWYRKGWFDSSFQIRIGDSGTFQSLDSLRETNGVGCPFSKIVDNNAKLDEFEKIAANLKDQLSHAEELRARITVIENEIVVRSKTRKAESDTKLAAKKEIDSLFLRIRTSMMKLSHRFFDPNTMSMSQVADIFNGELAERYEFYDPTKSFEHNYLAATDDAGILCPDCYLIAWNPKQYILHATNSSHIIQMISPNCSVTDSLLKEFKNEIKVWKKEDKDRIDDRKRMFEMKFGKNFSIRDFRPTNEFMAHFHIDIENLFPPNCMAYRVGRIYKSDGARELLDVFHNHLLTGIPFCARCSYLSIDINDFYRHMVTYDHWAKVMESPQFFFDFRLTALICNNHSEKYFM